ncbi:hypothetical protein [Tritonibacter mobilis]|uniref:hypothetical protein n=1 Tax=Tritonibacter mobilis TaxID=379347 RepID=UPI001CD9C488|nr:hypothetical protein [Tritonibacter mobilis]MCA2009087.1 hypothetical protein [Tritonibacter mobilis]
MTALSATYKSIATWISVSAFIATLLAKYFEAQLPTYLRLLATDYITYASGVVILVVFVGAAIRAPYSLFREERDQRKILENKRKPSLAISVTEPSGSDQCAVHVNQTEGGFRFPHPTLKYRNALHLSVTNTSEIRVGPCVATIQQVELKTKSGYERKHFAEGIKLPWNIDDIEGSLSQHIEAASPARVWIASIDYNGNTWVLRESEALQSDQKMIFGEKGTYRAKLLISDGSSLSKSVTIELVTAPALIGSYHQPGVANLKILEQDNQP